MKINTVPQTLVTGFAGFIIAGSLMGHSVQPAQAETSRGRVVG